jgi:hypothetical protein
MNRYEVGAKRPLSHGVISNPELRQDDRDEIAKLTDEYLAKGNKIEQLDSVDELCETKRAAVNYGAQN